MQILPGSGILWKLYAKQRSTAKATMNFSIQSNFPQIQARIASLQKDVAQKASTRAINVTAKSGQSQASRQIAKQYTLTASKAREAINIKRATFRGGMANIQAEIFVSKSTKRSFNVINFQARKVAKGVSVKITRSQSRKVIGNAFIANKGRTVFARVPQTQMASRPNANKHGNKIVAVQTIGIGQMFNARKIKDVVVHKIEQEFPKVFERELAFYLSKAK